MDAQAKKATLRMIPYGLYVVGVRDEEVADVTENVNAFIGSWVTQTSFDPPMLVTCVKRDSGPWHRIRATGVFTLNILGEGQKPLGAKFLKKHMDVTAAKDGDAHAGLMEGVPFVLEEETGCPVFPDIPAWVACRVVHTYDDGNDHTVFVARIVNVGVHGDAANLSPLTHEETGWHYAG